MNTTELKGKWDEQKGKLKQKFAALTDDDLLLVEGKKEEMMGKLQIKLGKTKEELEKHFDFYEPFTVHESSLSPCVHSIQAAVLGRMEQAYTFYLRTSRLDLDDYNKEVEEGLHITSMAGTWMSIVEGFGGMRVKNNQLHFEPKIPAQWNGYSFKVNFRNAIVKVDVSHQGTAVSVDGNQDVAVIVNGESQLV